MAVNSRAQKIELLVLVNLIFIILHKFHIATTNCEHVTIYFASIFLHAVFYES
jgi:hypothetical protein